MTGRALPIRARAVEVHVLRQVAGRWEVLLLRRVDPPVGAWFPAAGGIEAGEKAWMAALRELEEEAGLVPERLYAAGIIDHFYSISADAVAALPVFVAYVSPEAEVRLNGEHDAHAWLSFDEAIDRVSFGSQRIVLRHVREEFTERTPTEHLKIRLPARSAL